MSLAEPLKFLPLVTSNRAECFSLPYVWLGQTRIFSVDQKIGDKDRRSLWHGGARFLVAKCQPLYSGWYAKYISAQIWL